LIDPKYFFELLLSNGINFFTGVPDSLLKEFCGYVSDNVSKEDHIINSSEGGAIALATGSYLTTGKPAMVYMQNSGLGNAVNPLLSLADKEVYSIPILMMIGWRGEPGKKDEPQHIKQGRVMLKMLEAMEIPYTLINKDTGDIETIIKNICDELKEKKSAHALVISEGTFEKYTLKNDTTSAYELMREDAVKLIIDNIESDAVIVSTTGKTSREVFEYRKSKKQGHEKDFLTVGSMGHCSEIALGIALHNKNKKVYILDGDGAVIMHMGSMAIIGSSDCENIKHIIINNGAHDSVGGQPTVGFGIEFTEIARACGYKKVFSAETTVGIVEKLSDMKNTKGPTLLEIRVNKGAREDLGRPTSSPEENKLSFMNYLNQETQ